MARGLIIAALILGFLAFDIWGIRWLVAPWSFETLGPTLTGTWDGTLRAREGAEFRVFLDLGYATTRRRPWGTNLTGRALLCTQHGDLYEYEVSGDADRDGHNVEVEIEYGDPNLSALDMRFYGDWNGQVLTLTPRQNPFLPDGRFVSPRSVSSSDPDDRFVLAEFRKSDRPSFLASCGRLAR
jgi:hypothetical protein